MNTKVPGVLSFFWISLFAIPNFVSSQDEISGRRIDTLRILDAIREEKIQFTSQNRITVELDSKNIFSVERVLPAAQFGTQPAVPDAHYLKLFFLVQAAAIPGMPPRPLPPRNPGNGTKPEKPPKPPPGPIKPPPPPHIPIPPGGSPSNGGGTPPGRPPPKPPKKEIIKKLADAGTILGRMKTDGLNYGPWIVKQGTHVLLLTKYEEIPVVTLVDEKGYYGLSFDHFHLMDLDD